MPRYAVDLYEGKNLVTYEVEASSEEEANEKALAAREQFFQEDTSRAALEEERKQIQSRMENQPGVAGRAVESARRFGSTVLSGMADATLSITQGVTDLMAAAGGPRGAMAGLTSQSLQEKRNSVKDFNQEVLIDSYSRVAGRELTEAEKALAVERGETALSAARVAAEIGLTAGVGGTALRASTAPRMVGVGFTEGALSGWLLGGESDDIKARQAERLGTAAFGSVVGLGASFVPGVFAGAKNWLIRQANKAGGGNILAKRAAMTDAGISSPVTVGQLTGDADFLAAEAQAAGRKAEELYRQQQTEVAGSLAQKIGIQIPPMSQMTTGTRKIVREGIERTARALGTLRGQRNKAFEDGLNTLEDMTGGQPVIKFDGVADVVNDMIDGVESNYRNVAYSPNFKTLIRDLDDAVRNGATPKRANSILLRLNQMKKSGSGLFDESNDVVKGSIDMYRGHTQKIAASIKTAVEEAFDNTAARIGGEPGAMLKQLRDNYGAASREIGVIEDELMGALGMKGDVSDILRRLGNADDEAVSSAMHALRKLPGGYDFQQKLLAGVYRQAVQDGSAAALGFSQKGGTFNLRAFIQSLGKNGEQSKLKGFLSPQQEKSLVKGMDAIKVLLNDPRQANPRGVIRNFLAVELQSIAINALSRDPGFMARLVAQGVQRGQGAEALFFTKEGIDLLTGATKSAVVGKGSGQIGGAIVAILATMLGGGVAEERGRELLESMEQQK